MNKIILIGNLTRDPELKTTQTGKSVATASVATSKRWVDKDGNKQDSSQFHNLVIWGKQAEAFAKYLKKGKKVSIIGEQTSRKYQAQDGTNRYVSEVIVSEFEFLSPAEKNNAPEPTEYGNEALEKYIDPADDNIDVNNIPF
jgi:single-strand DNA-binding protein